MRYFILLSSVWAGLAIGGNLIAAPAKFQVGSLSLADLLQVGRAQFTWLGYAEWFCVALILSLCILIRSKPPFSALLAISLFTGQQLVLQPMLKARSDLIILGGPTDTSHLHVYFVVIEITKIGLLLWCAARTSQNQIRGTDRRDVSDTAPGNEEKL